MNLRSFSAWFCSAFLLAPGLTGAAHAQGTLVATAQVVGQASGGSYNYTLTLNNDISSTDPIQTLWFAWFPGADLLPTLPTGITTPMNWTASVQGGVTITYGYPYPDGYSIEFTTTDPGSALMPGNSMQFGFTSTDSPTSLGGLSPYPWYAPGAYQVGISYVYASGAPGPGIEPTGTSASFAAVVPAPEPSGLGLLAVGALLFFVAPRMFHPRPVSSR